MSNLNAKQEAFCQEYVVDHNATQAAIRSGYSEASAAQIGHENLKKLEVKHRIQELEQGTGRDLNLTKRDIYRMLLETYESAPQSKDKLKAIELMGKMIGAFTDRLETTDKHEEMSPELEQLLRDIHERTEINRTRKYADMI